MQKAIIALSKDKVSNENLQSFRKLKFNLNTKFLIGMVCHQLCILQSICRVSYNFRSTYEVDVSCFTYFPLKLFHLELSTRMQFEFQNISCLIVFREEFTLDFIMFAEGNSQFNFTHFSSMQMSSYNCFKHRINFNFQLFLGRK